MGMYNCLLPIDNPLGLARSAAVVIVILTISVNVGLIMDAMSQGRTNKQHADPASVIAPAGTANGHAVGSLSSSSGTSSVRRSNQLKLQAGLPTGICVKSLLMWQLLFISGEHTKVP